jgi:acyl-coenzyme A thioesterase PaaI-like protein
MSRTRDYRTSVHDLLTQSAAGADTTRVVTLDPRFQGLPDAAHGGTVLALFDALAAPGASRTVVGAYRRRVPLATPLTLTIDRGANATRLRLSDAGATLVDGTVADDASPGVASGAEESESVEPSNETPLPVSKTCFACGTDNTLGLRARLAVDDKSVGGVWTPDENFRVGDTVATVAVTTLLDEAAFWLGAAASGEAGMTTELRVRFHGPAVFGPLVVGGSRADVRARADDPRYWETEIAAWDASGALVASAAITFVAVRGTARKLVAGLLAVNPLDVLRRVFPAYVR